MGKTKDSEQNGSKHSMNFIALNFFMNPILICYYCPKYSNFATLIEGFTSNQ
jgi:hypothetical protein